VAPEAITFRPATAADWPAIRALLESQHLPTAGAEAHLADFIVAGSGGALAGCIGMERHGPSALLRSAAVASTLHCRGIGGQLVTRLIEVARRSGINDIALLTTTAETYFAKRGFHSVPLEELVAAFGESEEMRGACPATAIAMRLMLHADW
jgi:N-acetylglutamate synthase-like GNAT family acetyltransferase